MIPKLFNDELSTASIAWHQRKFPDSLHCHLKRHNLSFLYHCYHNDALGVPRVETSPYDTKDYSMGFPQAQHERAAKSALNKLLFFHIPVITLKSNYRVSWSLIRSVCVGFLRILATSLLLVSHRQKFLNMLATFLLCVSVCDGLPLYLAQKLLQGNMACRYYESSSLLQFGFSEYFNHDTSMGSPNNEFYMHVTVTITNFLSFPSEREFLHLRFTTVIFSEMWSKTGGRIL